MFNPIYQLLRKVPGLWLGVSSGRYRHKGFFGWFKPHDPEFWNEKLFAEFDIAPGHLVKTSHQDRTPYDVFVASNESSLIQPKTCRKTVQIFHGVSFRNFAVRPEYARFDKLFFPGRYMMQQYLDRGYLEPNDPRIELVGMPKLDRLVDGSIKSQEVLKELGLDPTVPTVLWCPTGARHNSYEVYGQAAIKAIQETGVNLIVKLHDHPHLYGGLTTEDIIKSVRDVLGPRGRLATHSDVTPLLVAADLLISDASSVAYEFCILDRPIVFLDVPELLNERAAMDGSNMDLNTHGRNVGRIVTSAEELKEAITAELANPSHLSKRRRAAAEDIFFKPGTATPRAARRLSELAGIPAAALDGAIPPV